MWPSNYPGSLLRLIVTCEMLDLKHRTPILRTETDHHIKDEKRSAGDVS